MMLTIDERLARILQLAPKLDIQFTFIPITGYRIEEIDGKMRLVIAYDLHLWSQGETDDKS